MTAQNNKFQKGFTLIELLVVIGILAVLLAITLIAINPARQFGNANNTARRSHVTQILNAVGQYVAENKGQLPAEITALTAGAAATPLTAANFPNLCGQLVPTYIPALPKNPSVAGSDITAADCALATPVWDTG
jgi:prepilin-type N-terminal cleavage/methylation domain-containing protein